MFLPKEIAQNFAMRLPLVRRFARSRHNTGVQNDVSAARHLYDQYERLAARNLSELSILELGPGQGVDLMKYASTNVKDYAAFDVEAYLAPAELSSFGIDYRVDATGNIPWPNDSFDVIWSYSVLEHVRHPSASVNEMIRVLKPDGQIIAMIDLQDHYEDRSDPHTMFHFLIYREWVWNLMTSNRSSYSNRLRASEWINLFESRGLQIIQIERTQARCSLQEFSGIPYLAELDEEDIMTIRFWIVATK